MVAPNITTGVVVDSGAGEYDTRRRPYYREWMVVPANMTPGVVVDSGGGEYHTGRRPYYRQWMVAPEHCYVYGHENLDRWNFLLF